MKTIKAKQTIAGASYNRLRVGDTAEVTDKVAKELEKAGLVEIVDEGSEDADDTSVEKSGVTITDNTNKEKKEVNVQGEKKSDAGPSGKSSTATVDEGSEDADKKKLKK